MCIRDRHKENRGACSEKRGNKGAEARPCFVSDILKRKRGNAPQHCGKCKNKAYGFYIGTYRKRQKRDADRDAVSPTLPEKRQKQQKRRAAVKQSENKHARAPLVFRAVGLCHGEYGIVRKQLVK